VTELNLRENDIGGQGATGHAEALKVNQTLAELNLRYNGIGDQGATGLAEALKVNQKVTELNLRDNDIGGQGATGLAEALKVNSTLRFLNLSYNNIGEMVLSELYLLQHDGCAILLSDQLPSWDEVFSASDSDFDCK